MTFVTDTFGNGAEKRFTAEMIPDQSSKVFIVTGGHAGIGLATTRALASAGAKVYIASRSPSKVKESISILIEELPELKTRVKFVQMDLASLQSTKAAAETFLTLETRLDGIVCNAGIMEVPYALTEDGIEQQFQVNHLAHFLFVLKLAPLMESTAKMTGHPSRVINLSSFAHNFMSWMPFSASFTSLQDVNRSFFPINIVRYAQAKLSNILFSREINRRFGDNIKSLAVHPGFVASGVADHLAYFRPLKKYFIETSEGAINSLYALTSPEVETKKLWGSYIVPFAKVASTSSYGENEELAQQLWELSEALVVERVGAI